MRPQGKCIRCIANGAESQLQEKDRAILITDCVLIKIKNAKWKAVKSNIVIIANYNSKKVYFVAPKPNYIPIEKVIIKKEQKTQIKSNK